MIENLLKYLCAKIVIIDEVLAKLFKNKTVQVCLPHMVDVRKTFFTFLKILVTIFTSLTSLYFPKFFL